MPLRQMWSIYLKIAVRIRGQQMAKYADGRQEAVGLTEPVIIELTYSPH
ncbi:hypothetical protein [Scytonema sp. PCC 10023]